MALKFKGVFVNVGYMDNITNVEVDLKKIHAQRHSIHGISNAYVTRKDIIKTVEGFKRNVLPYLGRNKEKPIIDKIYNFDDIDIATNTPIAGKCSSTTLGNLNNNLAQISVDSWTEIRNQELLRSDIGLSLIHI